MINCRSIVLRCCVRSSLVLPQTPWSSFPDLMSYFFSFTAKLYFVFFFLFTAKAYLICAVPPQTPYLLPAPSTSSMQLFVNEIATCRTRVTRHFQRISPRNGSSNISYNQSSFFFFFLWWRFNTFFQNGRVCLTHPGWGFSASSVSYCQYTLVTQRQTASEFTSVFRASYRHVKYEIFYNSMWTHFEKTSTVVFSLYFIITVFVTTWYDGLKVEKNRIVLRTRSAYLYVLFVWPYYQIDILLFLGSMVMAFVSHFLQPQIIRSCVVWSGIVNS